MRQPAYSPLLRQLQCARSQARTLVVIPSETAQGEEVAGVVQTGIPLCPSEASQGEDVADVAGGSMTLLGRWSPRVSPWCSTRSCRWSSQLVNSARGGRRRGPPHTHARCAC